ncbi:MAG: hypothetical protein JW953_01470 [Anaerolineae bacterium]|nr:hypothetical protein [Anaerolineae bacterium]
MKQLLILVVVFVFLFSAMPAMAQEPQFESPVPTATDEPVEVTPTANPTEEPTPTFDWPEELPGTAQEGLEILAGFITFVSSLLAMYATRFIRKLPIVNDGEKSKITGLAADAVAAITALAIGLVLAYGAYAADFLDGNGFWQVLVYVFPLLWGMHKAKKISGIAKLLPALIKPE